MYVWRFFNDVDEVCKFLVGLCLNCVIKLYENGMDLLWLEKKSGFFIFILFNSFREIFLYMIIKRVFFKVVF